MLKMGRLKSLKLLIFLMQFFFSGYLVLEGKLSGTEFKDFQIFLSFFYLSSKGFEKFIYEKYNKPSE